MGGTRISLLAPWLLAGVVLLLPLFSMQFTQEVKWDGVDFALMGGLLFGGCALYQAAAVREESIHYRTAIGIAVIATILLIWINLAVGILGSEANPANLIFAGVVAVEVIGAALSRLRARGMARALFATAVAQTLAGAVGLTLRLGSTEAHWAGAIIVLTAFFTGLWLLSAFLFSKAGRS